MKMKSVIKKSWNLQSDAIQESEKLIGQRSIGNQWCCPL